MLLKKNLFFVFSCGPLETNAILVGHKGAAAVIDPSPGSSEKILFSAEKNKLKIEKILLTHSHWDHFADAAVLKEKTGASLYVHQKDAKNLEHPGSDGIPLFIPIRPVRPDGFFVDGQIIEAAGLSFEVIHTPGHSPGSVCFYLSSMKVLFSGDTLFCKSMGRIDLPTGNAQDMKKSLAKLSRLPKDTDVVPGHGSQTSIGAESWIGRPSELF